MADRTVLVRLQADIGNYVSGMAKASMATKGIGDTATDTGRKAKGGFDIASSAAGMMGIAAAGALAGVISKSMDFEKSMSGVRAATQASAGTLGDLRDAAIKAGADTQYSATEAADAITEMAKAGVSAGDIMGGGLTGALSLAAAGQMDVADAAGIASVAMTQFKLSGDKLPHVADLLAAGAGKAMGSVDDLGQALNQAGLLASASGISIEETTGTLAAFASAGLIGSDAGTSFKTMLQMLQNPSQESAALLGQLGINAYDAQGNFVGLSNLAGQLHDKLGGLTQAQRDQALAQIFGSDAARAANVLYTEGAQGIADWTNKVNDAGYAQRQAADLTDNLAGDLERLGGSFDTLLISIGSGAQGGLRELVQALGFIVDGVNTVITTFDDLPGPVQTAIGVMGGLALLNGPLDSVKGKVVDFASTTITKMALVAESTMASGTIMGTAGAVAKAGWSGFMGMMGGPLGLALVGVTTGLSLLSSTVNETSDATDAATRATENYTEALKASKGVIDGNVRSAAAKAAQDAGLLDLAERAGIKTSLMTDAILNQSGAYDQVKGGLQAYHDSLIAQANAEASASGASNEHIVSLFTQAGAVQDQIDTLGGLVGATQDTVAGQQQLTAATQETADTATGAAAQTTTASEEAQKAYNDWIKSVADVEAAFVEPLSIYKQMVQEAAQATADATADSKDSWQDYADSSKISLDQFAQQLQDQITAQENWHKNLVTVAQRAGYDVAAQLEQMGVEGAGLVAQMANSTDSEMQRMAGLLRKDAENGGAGAATALDNSMKVMAQIGKDGATATAQGIADKLGIGVDQVAAIAKQYGVALSNGINPILTGVGKARIAIDTNANNLKGIGVGGRATGGYISGPGGPTDDVIPAMLSNGEFVVRASATSQHRDLLERINSGDLAHYATGGFVSARDVPRPYSTAPSQPPISTAADGTMSLGYQAVTDWLDANGSGVLGTGAVSGTWTAIWGWIKSRVPEARINSSYRPGDPGYHGRNKAVDLGFGSGPGGNGSAGLALINRTLYDGLGRNLAELMYDGVGDDRADIKNGANHLYNPTTRDEHHNHVHAAVYHGGTDSVPQDGWAYLAKGEQVVPASMSSREFTGTNLPGGGGSVQVNLVGAQITGRLEMGTDGLVSLVDGRIVQTLTAVGNRGRYNG